MQHGERRRGERAPDLVLAHRGQRTVHAPLAGRHPEVAAGGNRERTAQHLERVASVLVGRRGDEDGGSAPGHFEGETQRVVPGDAVAGGREHRTQEPNARCATHGRAKAHLALRENSERVGWARDERCAVQREVEASAVRARGAGRNQRHEGDGVAGHDRRGPFERDDGGIGPGCAFEYHDAGSGRQVGEPVGVVHAPVRHERHRPAGAKRAFDERREAGGAIRRQLRWLRRTGGVADEEHRVRPHRVRAPHGPRPERGIARGEPALGRVERDVASHRARRANRCVEEQGKNDRDRHGAQRARNGGAGSATQAVLQHGERRAEQRGEEPDEHRCKVRAARAYRGRATSGRLSGRADDQSICRDRTGAMSVLNPSAFE